MSSAPASSVFTKDNPFPACLAENRLLNGPGSIKDTRHLVVSLAGSDLHYKVGDSLGVYPTNRPEDVAEVLRLLGASGEEAVSPAMLKLAAPLPLRTVLSQRLSLAGPTRKILETLAAKTTAADEQARLAALLDPAASEAMSAFLKEREYLDLLAEFPGARLTAQEFVDHLRKLMPRLYSIASSSRVHPQEVHLTVAVVRYESNGRPRRGVCSTFLAERVPVGQPATVPVFVSDSHFAVPEDKARDIIMVGPGTGIAPFRAFMQERVATVATGRNWLFFGDQRRACDYLYGDEWADLQARGVMTRVDLAFSRDQAGKIYVQDRMREAGAELWAWLQGGAYFYVCGDAKRMAKDVDAALHEIIVQHGAMDAVAAADYVKQLRKEKRYLRDVY